MSFHRARARRYPLRVDYALTSSGLKLVPLIDAIGDWWEETANDRLSKPVSDAATLPSVLATKREAIVETNR